MCCESRNWVTDQRNDLNTHGEMEEGKKNSLGLGVTKGRFHKSHVGLQRNYNNTPSLTCACAESAVELLEPASRRFVRNLRSA